MESTTQPTTGYHFTKIEHDILTARGAKGRPLTQSLRCFALAVRYRAGTSDKAYDGSVYELTCKWGMTNKAHYDHIKTLAGTSFLGQGWLTRIYNSRFQLPPVAGKHVQVPNCLIESELKPWVILAVAGIISHKTFSTRNEAGEEIRLYHLYRNGKTSNGSKSNGSNAGCFPAIADFAPKPDEGTRSDKRRAANALIDAMTKAGMMRVHRPGRHAKTAKVSLNITEGTIAALLAVDGTLARSRPTHSVQSMQGVGRATSETSAKVGATHSVHLQAAVRPTHSPHPDQERPTHSPGTADPLQQTESPPEPHRKESPKKSKKGPEQEIESQQADGMFAAVAANGDGLSARGQQGVETEAAQAANPGSQAPANPGSQAPAYSWNFQVPDDLDPEDLIPVPLDLALILDNGHKNCVKNNPGIFVAALDAQDSGKPFLVPAFFARALDPEFVYSLARPAASVAEGRTSGDGDGHEQAPRRKPQDRREKSLSDKDGLKAKEREKAKAGNAAADASKDKHYRAFVRLYNQVLRASRERAINLGHPLPKSVYVTAANEPTVRAAWSKRREHFQTTFMDAIEAVTRSRFLLGLSKGLVNKDGTEVVPWALNPFDLLSKRWDDVLAGKYDGLYDDKVRPIVDRLRDPLCYLLAECRDRGASPREVFDSANCGWFAAWEIELVVHHAKRLMLEARLVQDR